MKNVVGFLLALVCFQLVYAQEDTLSYKDYRDRLVIHSSFSYKDAPFTIKDKFGTTNKLSYEANLNLIHGFGIAYKWFALNINYKLPKTYRNEENFGRTKYFDGQLGLNIREWFIQAKFHDYKGYGINNAQLFSDTIPVTSQGYYLDNGLKTISLGLDIYHFLNPEMRMKASQSIVEKYKKTVHGIYLNFGVKLYSISSSKGILPYNYMEEPLQIQRATQLGAIETGGIPGYAVLAHFGDWQIGGSFGVGFYIQGKYYVTDGNTKSHIGLSPRGYLSFNSGYNVDNWFVLLSATFEQNNITFYDYKYNQLYYNVKLTGGYRFKIKQKDKK